MKTITPFVIKKLTGTLLLLICILLFFSSCAKAEPENVPYSTTVDGQDITISFYERTKSEGTITSENGVYTFSYSFDGTFFVVYPNGYTYSQKNTNGAIGVSWDYNESPEELGYISGFNLEWAVESASKSDSVNQKAVSPIISIVLLGSGLFCMLSPKSLWWLSRGWMYKNVEPSDLVLLIYRIVGIIAVLFGLISFFA